MYLKVLHWHNCFVKMLPSTNELPYCIAFLCSFLLSLSEYYHYRQNWIPLRWLPAESVFENDFSTKSDVWAFGVLMWEVFSHGELPYSSLSHEDVLEGANTNDYALAMCACCYIYRPQLTHLFLFFAFVRVSVNAWPYSVFV